MNLRNMALSGRSQSQTTHDMIPFMGNVLNGQIQSDGKQVRGFHGLRFGGRGCLLTGTGFSFWGDENVLKGMAVVVTPKPVNCALETGKLYAT